MLKANKELPPAPVFLTVVEVAELLRVKPRTVRDWVQQGTIPHHRPPRSRFILFDREEVIAWAKGERSERPVTPEAGRGTIRGHLSEVAGVRRK